MIISYDYDVTVAYHVLYVHINYAYHACMHVNYAASQIAHSVPAWYKTDVISHDKF